jgi:monovalent cation/hydrogen antiporter
MHPVHVFELVVGMFLHSPFILVTVLVQGTTLGRLIRAAGLHEDEHSRPPLDLFAAEAAMIRVQAAAMERHAYAADGTLVHPRLLDSYRRRATMTETFEGTATERTQAIDSHYDAILFVVAAGRAELVRLHRAGQIDDETLHDLERDLDLEELTALAAKSQP